MDQELKQRLIGAAVITALAAIFVPMLFDDPIDESGKSINQLKIPELPSKAQDVEIMPLPEKVEDVATVDPIEKPQSPAGYRRDDNQEAVTERSHSSAVITEQDAYVAPRAKPVESDSAEQTVMPEPKTPRVSRVEPVRSTEPVTPKSSVAIQNATVRWYLNAGSFSKKSNAAAMLESLRKQGFATSIKEAVSDKGTIYKVRVGPMLSRAKAQEMKARLAKIHVNSFVSGED